MMGCPPQHLLSASSNAVLDKIPCLDYVPVYPDVLSYGDLCIDLLDDMTLPLPPYRRPYASFPCRRGCFDAHVDLISGLCFRQSLKEPLKHYAQTLIKVDPGVRAVLGLEQVANGSTR